MKKLSLLYQGALLVCIYLSASPKLPASNFLHLSLAEAKTKAAQLQQPLLVHFSANWCLPCQWMNKNTFADPEVSLYLQQQYLAVKIDVDEVQGYADKEACGVKYLPSVLIFNAAGIVLMRFEETIDAERMLDALMRYNTPANRIPANSSLAMPLIKEDLDETQSLHLPFNDSKTMTAGLEDDPAHLDAQRISGQHPNGPPVPSPRKLGIQVGVFSNYENVIRQVQFFEKKFYKPVYISSNTTQNQTYYHLIAGPFETPLQMQNYLNALQREGLKGIIVNL